jgi:transposase-like protein
MSIKTYLQKLKPSYNISWSGKGGVLDRLIEHCPYCLSRRIIRRGRRRTRHESIQLYFCKDCEKTFTPIVLKSKKYPLKAIFDGLSYYNLGHSKADTLRLIKGRYGYKISQNTLTNWIKELEPICRYPRLRAKIARHCHPQELIQTTVLNHQQTYNFRYHPEKFKVLVVQEPFKLLRYEGLLRYFESISEDFPHHYFRTDRRSSQTKAKFDFGQMRIPRKENHATRLAGLILQAVTDNRQRHESLQQFMLVNDSVTVAMETPIYLTPEDLKHFQEKLKFKIPFKVEGVLTGHIDLLQLRNGLVHILDYKPKAKSEKPYAQLLIYALALSRLTGLRLMDFKCAWFDENDYFEFFPLHLIHKLPRY